MRIAYLAAAVAAIAAIQPAAAAAATKAEKTVIAICFTEDTQYTQTIGGQGFFHVSNHNGTYDTQKLVQTVYDGTTVCAVPDPKAPRANSDIAMVCANLKDKMVSVLYRRDTQTKMVRPANALPYCKARIDVLG